MKFKTAFLKVVIANLVSLLLSITTGFLVPGFLSIDQYAFLKTFTLYLSFVEILHFGFVNGMHIKYGGLELNEIKQNEVKAEHRFFLIFQIILCTVVAVIGVSINNYLLVAFAIIVMPINMIAMFKSFYQAIGEFQIYSRIILMMSILTLLMRLFNIYIINLNSYWTFVIGLIVVKYIIFIILEIKYYAENRKIIPAIENREINNHFKIGVFVLVGNLASTLVYSIDSWFVKMLFSAEDFAYYSFAISIFGTINVVINSVTLVFYPYLSKNKNETKAISEVSTWLFLIGTLLTGTYYIFSFIINKFLPKYIYSLDIIAILFLGYPALIIIKAIYVNMYKAKKEERKYVKIMIKFLSISVILNIVAILLYKNIFSIAIATTLSFYIWFYFNNIDFKIDCCNNKGKIYLIIFIIIFSFSTYYFNWWIGFIVFYISIISFIGLFYRQESFNLIKFLLKK